MEEKVEGKKQKPGIPEKTVRKIIERFFQMNMVELIPTRGAGPDFLYDGNALEIKGSGAKGAMFNKAISQYIRYVFTYSNLEIALPIDILHADSLIKLDLLSRIIWELLHKKIKTYLVTTHEHECLLKEFDDCKDVLSRVLSKLTEWCEGSYRAHRTIQEVRDDVEDNLRTTVNEAIWKALNEIILADANMRLDICDL